MARSVALNWVPITEKRTRLVELLATAIRWLNDVRNFTQKGSLSDKGPKSCSAQNGILHNILTRHVRKGKSNVA